MSSIRNVLATANRVLSTDSEKTLVDPPSSYQTLHRPNTTQNISTGAGATPTIPQKTAKPNLYHKKRGPLRRAGRNLAERVVSIIIFSGDLPNILRARTAGREEPTYAAHLQAMISEVVAQKIQDEEEDEQLRTLLGGRIVGGANKFGRVKLRRDKKDRIDGAGWRRMLDGRRPEMGDSAMGN
ncbi:hypothetical protein B0H19DRAFT_1255304 [Mycena capillaripes]|nr:hypothetical protein B0H19DRAFT_1255304 [Mycena capillaripes]